MIEADSVHSTPQTDSSSNNVIRLVHSAPRKRRSASADAALPAQSKKDREELERTSPIINAGVRYVQAMTGLRAGFKADPTGENVVAGLGEGEQGKKQLKRARRAMYQLWVSAKRTKNPSAVEISSMARVMRFVLEEWKNGNWELDKDITEFLFLLSFVDAVVRALECEP
jgi:hypothetical protein